MRIERKIEAYELNKKEVIQKRTPEDRKLIETYQKHKQIYDDFCHKLAIDKRKLDVINQKLSALEMSIKELQG